ncbi:serine protease inhibitor serpin [Holotrichia oblita]|uniref:Serine protease inhibitor serpin n=1 Tax=Holotrichia oblita TaxID=644536 RepID=A0ACB9SQJ7_HOLOL|nr:serine protease inhibitor serpin [Holotrichia oblita]
MVSITHSTNTPRGINPFGNKLYNVISNEHNLIFSPISIHAALSLAYQGSTGATADSFKQNLEVPDTNQNAEEYKNFMMKLKEDGNVTIYLANKMYVQETYKLKDHFKATAETYFFADGQNIDFSKEENAANTMNTWVKESTGGKIDHLIEPEDLSDDTRAVLLNAIYFKANWLTQFEEEKTGVEKFFVSDSESFDCQMMHQKDKFEYAENSELDAKILKIKYKDERFSMVIILPNSYNKINDLENELIHKDISNLTRRRKATAIATL